MSKSQVNVVNTVRLIKNKLTWKIKILFTVF